MAAKRGRGISFKLIPLDNSNYRALSDKCPYCGRVFNDLVLRTKHSALACPKRPKNN